MTARISFTMAAVLALAGISGEVEERPAPPRIASDSALSELAAGRFWHAARLLRAEGSADGAPEDVLLLARAEAGWEDWPAVAELLRGADWLDRVDGGSGQYLLGRALEHQEAWLEAADAYGRYVGLRDVPSTERTSALARRARTLWQSGEYAEALASLERLAPSSSVRSWMAAELTLASVAEGDTAGVRSLLPHIVDGRAAQAVWRAEADAIAAAGDALGASDAYRVLRERVDGARRGDITVELGRLRLAAGDTVEGRALLLEGLGSATGDERTRAAEALADLGGFEMDRTLELARILDRAGDGRRALLSYDRANWQAQGAGTPLAESARLERARIMATVPARQEEALEEFRAIRETTTDARIGARNLDVWRQLRSRQGMDAQVRTIRDWLFAEYPGSTEAIEIAWSEGSGAEGNGRLDVALQRYSFISENAPTSSRAGESRMRSGQIYLRRDDTRRAAEVFEQYLTDFPNGRRWQEAAYWAGRTRLELGDSAEARAHLTRAMLEQPTEYYAVVAADLLGVPYEVDVPEGEGPEEPMWLTAGLARLDGLIGAGLDRGVAAEVAAMRGAAEGSRGATLRLADALIERGMTIQGINLGWALLERSDGWDRQLLRVTFPFPYRELVRREAAEWGVDPLILAAIIRQESAFEADIVSRAGAIGLMQVMPPTGEQLARRHGPNPFIEEALTRPEVNLHLGAAFFVDMSARYDDDLPLVLSAYNAGPTRANRWRAYPEASDPLRFTERIPFDETRGYVKNVRRNLGLYRALYGDD
jgi:soluble lytic murein transglycosylase